MKKRKLVIINDNERFCMELKSRFVKYGYIVMAKLKTADEALSFFEKGNKPDVAIVDMLMPKYDGSQLLHRIKTMGKGKGTVFIGISALYTDEAIRMAQSAGFAYMIALPCAPLLIAQRVDELMDVVQNSGLRDTMALIDATHMRCLDCDDIIAQYLTMMGLAVQHSGFVYAAACIKMYVENGVNSPLRLTQDVYPAVAKRYNTNAKAVERSIRYAINTAWLKGDMEMQHQLFGYTVDRDKGCPTNKEYITMIAEHTRIRLKINMNHLKSDKMEK